MKISIEYESSWRNSFLDGSNNEPLPKQGRDYVASGSRLKESEDNFKRREVTKDTVMGILNRLIGDQRKLYQSRVAEGYFFKELEALVSFEDSAKSVCAEIVYLRNIKGSYDQNSFSGMIKVSDPLFSSDYSAELWGVLAMDLPELVSFVAEAIDPLKAIALDPVTVMARLDFLNEQKWQTVDYTPAVAVLQSRFAEFESDESVSKLRPISLYCCALYLKVEQLKKRFDLSQGLSKNG